MRREDIFGASPAERLAVAAVATITLALLLMMPGWRMKDGGPPAGEYAMSPEAFSAWEASFAGRYATEGGAVRPPPGDVPVLASQFTFAPALVLKVGATYRLNFTALDVVHSAAVDGREALLVPGRVEVLVITPQHPGPIPLQCGEYCGIGHSRMMGSIIAIP